MKAVTTTEKKAEIDILNVVFCIFVVIIHTVPMGFLKNDIAFLIHRALFCAIFGFVFLSGLKHGMKRNTMPTVHGTVLFYKSRLKKIILPYFVSYVFYYFFSARTFNIKGFILSFFLGDIAPHLYFVIAIAQIYLVSPLVELAVQKFRARHVLFAAFFINMATALCFYKASFFSIIFTRYIFCYAAGICIAQNYDAFCVFAKKKRMAIYTVTVICAAAELAFAFLLRKGVCSLFIQQIITTLYMMIIPVLLLCCVVTLCKTDVKSKVFAIINKNSYIIYLWHIAVIWAADFIQESVGLFISPVYFLFRLFLIAAALAVYNCLKSIILKGSLTGDSSKN